jgi:hypothetical protein
MHVPYHRLYSTFSRIRVVVTPWRVAMSNRRDGASDAGYVLGDSNLKLTHESEYSMKVS